MNTHEAESLARLLMDQYGVTAMGWTFGWNRAVTAYGTAYHSDKRIALSKPLTEANSREHVENTIRHEIAHALAPPHEHHGPEWKALAVTVGAKPTACSDGADVEPKWIGTCPNCARVQHANRRTNISCGNCSPVWDPRFRILWTENVTELTPAARICNACGGPLIGSESVAVAAHSRGPRSDTRYCSNACRQRAYRQRNHKRRRASQ